MPRWADLEALAAQGPGPRAAFLPERAGALQIAEHLAALANAEGGALIVTLSGRPQLRPGLADPGAVLKRTVEAVLLVEPRLVMPLPQAVAAGGAAPEDAAAVVLAQVPAGLPHVYAVQGRYLRREGRVNAPLLPFALQQLMVERSSGGYESQELEAATAEDLDWERVRRYVERLGLGPHADPRHALAQRGGLSATGRPTVAGILLFGRAPERLVRSSEIIAARYPGREMGDHFIREDIRGPLPDQIQRAEAFVLANMRRGAELRSLERTERLEYPPEVVREAIVNAVAHRDYGVAGEGIRILMFADRLEVYSPGRLPGHVTVDNILEERFSRNEIVVQVLSDLGYIERLGYGIDRMLALMQRDGLPPPAFAETANGFRVTLWSHAEALPAAPTPAAQWRWSGLNPRQELALRYVQEHERITNRDYQDLCPDVSPETLRRDLAEMVSKGLLLKIGEKRATFYVSR